MNAVRESLEGRVLLVRDGVRAPSPLARALLGKGYEVCESSRGDAIDAVTTHFRPDVVVLQVEHLRQPWLSLSAAVRGVTDVPLVVVADAATSEERVAAFSAGADDVVPAPFVVEEILARVRVAIGRAGGAARTVRQVGPMLLDVGSHTVAISGVAIALTPLEFAILARVADRPGIVVTKRQLMVDVWGYEHDTPNLVEVHVSALRRKLEASAPRLLHTERGVGYVVRAEVRPSSSGSA